MYEIGIFVIYMEEIFEHAENKTRDGQYLAKGTEA
jgi:hypothetical protein